ncbi:MAG: ribulose-phosphate 3-epimerase [Spirochaetes bacterium]|jgi:ribulose-phosphate 3-epimerase|nr:ribulose-phosphate 3-epimerase [Spirochaetota bacterium]
MEKISPSILSADFCRLGEEIKSVEDAGADYIHIDVMDGHFVPNITIGPFVVKAAKKAAGRPLDVHLMISDPDRYIDEFVNAGSDILTVHAEAVIHLHRTISYIKEKGVRAGVSINPSTPISAIELILEYVDMVVIMSVNPGFGGQKFIESVLPKISGLRNIIEKKNYNIELEVDGGITVDNIGKIAAAGANVFVSGSGIFGTKDYKKTIRLMRENIKK